MSNQLYTIDFRESEQGDWSSDVGGYGMASTPLKAAAILKDLMTTMPKCEFRVSLLELDTGFLSDATREIEKILAGRGYALTQQAAK